MTTGQASVHNKHYESARIFPSDISKPSLGLDLRFEQTYLKSIAPHVRLTTPASDEKRGYLAAQRLDIKWGGVIWVTTRDQVFAPMFQGMIWGTLSPWVQYFRGGDSAKKGRTSRTGAAIAKLRSWLSSIIPTTPTTSFRTK